MKTEEMKEVAFNLAWHMKRLGMSSQQLADRAGVNVKTINNILSARHASQIDVIAKLAKALKIPRFMLWLPEEMSGIQHDATFPGLVTLVAKLPAESRATIKRMAEFELHTSKPSKEA